MPLPQEKAPTTGPESGNATDPIVPESPILNDIVPASEAVDPAAEIKSPVTETGLPVAEQIRKEWDPNRNGGLPTPLRDAAR